MVKKTGHRTHQYATNFWLELLLHKGYRLKSLIVELGDFKRLDQAKWGVQRKAVNAKLIHYVDFGLMSVGRSASQSAAHRATATNGRAA